MRRRESIDIKKSESDLTAKLTKTLGQFNCFVIPFVANMRSMKGIPDRRLVHRDFRCFTEMKRENKPLTPAQKDLLTELWKRCDVSFIVRLWEVSRTGKIYAYIERKEVELVDRFFWSEPTSTRMAFTSAVREFRTRWLQWASVCGVLETPIHLDNL